MDIPQNRSALRPALQQLHHWENSEILQSDKPYFSDRRQTRWYADAASDWNTLLTNFDIWGRSDLCQWSRHSSPDELLTTRFLDKSSTIAHGNLYLNCKRSLCVQHGRSWSKAALNSLKKTFVTILYLTSCHPSNCTISFLLYLSIVYPRYILKCE